MEDNFDSIIYIIITIIAFAISALGKKKKKNANRVPVNTEDFSKPKERPLFSNLERILKEEMGIIDGNNQNEFITDPISEDNIQRESYSEEILDQASIEDDIPYSIEYEDTSKVFEETILKTDLTKTEEDPIIENFNIRDAVIYSEILNRKEY